jgi:hypothetical protein
LPNKLAELNKYDFTSLVKSPKQIGEKDIENLRELVKQFPYFAVAQNLLVKAFHNTKHYEYDKQLKQAALQAGNRAVLYNLVHDLPLEADQQDWMNQPMDNLQLPEPTPEIFPETVTEIIPEPTHEPEIIAQIEPVIIEPSSEPIEEIQVTESIEQVPEILVKMPEPIAEPIAEPISIVPARDPNIIYDDEKLIEPSGRFEKFIPKVKPNNTWDNEKSLIPDLGDEFSDILPDFDISSLNGFVAPPSTLKVEEKTPEPIEFKEVKHDVAAINPTPENEGTDAAFLDWISQKEPVKPIEEEIIEPIAVLEPILPVEVLLETPAAAPEPEPIEEDESFVNTLQNKFANEANTQLSEQITAINTETIEPIIVEPIMVEPIIVEPIVAEPIVAEPIVAEPIIVEPVVVEPVVLEANKIEPINAEPIKVEPIVVKPIIAEPVSEKTIWVEKPIEENLLASLENYEVNEFLAPLYLQVKYNDSLFDLSFEDVFEKQEAPKPIEWTEPFVVLNPIEEEIAVPEVPEPIIKMEEKPAVPIFEDLSYESTVWVNSQQQKEPAPEIHIPVKKEKIAPAEITPKIADLPPPKIARDPGTVESILDKFIRENPSIARPKSEFYSPVNMAKQSAEESEEIVSETLANIYTKQGLYKKAIIMYEKLGLHYPDKYTYFAGLIEQIKSAHNIE